MSGIQKPTHRESMFNRRNIAVNIRTRAAGINISNFTPDMTYHFPSICFSVKSPVPKRGVGKTDCTSLPRFQPRVQERPACGVDVVGVPLIGGSSQDLHDV